MDRRTRTSPDGDSRVTGSSDPYLGDLARMRRSMGVASTAGTGSTTHEWDGVNRREDEVSCFDPYLVSLARGARSDL